MESLCGGYWGRILQVDLGRQTVETQRFDEAFARKYLGGFGFAAKLLYDLIPADCDPLGPENVLVFATGPYQVTAYPGAGRAVAAAKSPLTGVWGASTAGGKFGLQLKAAGYDVVVIKGQSETPVYLRISGNGANLKPAHDAWGLDSVEAHRLLQAREADDKPTIAVIGPGGENRVRFAAIANDLHGYFGRCGLGAVMGSKGLKAVVVSGNHNPPVANPEKVKQLAKDIRQAIAKSPGAAVFREHGQILATESRDVNGLLPIKNFSLGNWDKIERIGARRITETLGHKPWACPNCVLGCHRRVTATAHGDLATGGLEYETLALIGSGLLIDDIPALARANEVLNRHAIDTMDAGGTIAWAFEAYENGYLTREDTGGLELTWGNGQALIELCGMIGRREGLGDLLADGLRACVAVYPETREYAVEAMGMTLPGHDPRAYHGQVIASIASTRGPCHLNALGEANELGVTIPELGLEEVTDRFSNKNKGYVSAVFQDVGQLWNSLCYCLCYYFEGLELPVQNELLNAITGWDTTIAEMIKTGERITNLQQLFNLKTGFEPVEENIMPPRLCQPRPTGEAADNVPDWEYILKDYWAYRGWDAQGRPTRSKLEVLGLLD